MKKFKNMGIITKINVLTAFVIVIIISSVGYLNNILEVKRTVSMTLRNAGRVSDFISRDIEIFMNDREISGIQNKLEQIKSEHGDILKLSLINSKGVVSASTDKALIGKSIEPRDTLCMACHYTNPPQSRIPSDRLGEIVEMESRVNVMRVATPIYNRSSCSNADCHEHGKDEKLLGLVSADYDFGDVSEAIKRRKIQTAATTAATVLLVMLMIAAFVWQFVGKPLRMLLIGMKRIEEGDLDQRIAHPCDDEIGTLAQAFNNMAQSLKMRGRELREAHDYLTDIVENSTDFIITADATGGIRKFNRGAEKILDYKRGEILGNNWRMLFYEEKDYQEFVTRLELKKHIVSYETRFRDRNGDAVEVLMTKSSLQELDGAGGSLLIGVDITEYKKVQKKLIQAERHAALGLAIAQILHGTKNILNAFRGGQYMVNTALKKDDRNLLLEGWQVTENGISRMTELTKGLLDFTRVGQLELRKASLPALCREVIDSFLQTALELNIKLNGELDEKLPYALIDSNAMHGALMNLVSNAIDACKWKEYEEGEGGEVTVKSYFDAGGGMVCVEVRDNGAGIPENIRNKIFTPFFSTKHAKGNGLGLPITKRVVQEHGGGIEVFSREGEGAAFTIRLPAAPEDETLDENTAEND